MGASYRGPRGHLITIATTINQPAFSMHQFDISRLRLRAHAISGAKRTMSGDGPFDDEFRVIEDGLPGSDRWLNASVRQAVRDLFAALPSNAVVWLQENELTALISTPWPPFDRAALEALLEKQSALARALEHSAARRL
jgi:hypothetical protein